MSHEVDERVVSMKFENEQFEAGIKQSEQSVHSFNDSLNNMGKGQALNGIAVNVAAISDRFSALGIIGKRVLENLTDSAMAFISKTAHTVTDSIVQGGIRRAMNIENAHFQLQGLLKDEEKVQAVMKDAMDSVDGTAYAYDSAAKAAAQFAASGLEAGPELQAALRGITGVAAMTSSEYENISEIFTTVAGNGRLMSMQLLQMSSRGLNAAATIRDFFNGVNDGSIQADENITKAIKNITKGTKTTEADIRDLVTKGKISFDMFSAAMDEAFGEHAKKANETLTGALSNVKSALARIGAEFISPLVVQNGPIVQLLNALRERINDVKKAIIPLAKLFTDAVSSIAASATKYLQNLDISAPIDRMVASFQKFGTFVKSLSTLGALKNLAEGIMFTFRGLGHVIDAFGQSFRNVFSGPSLYSVVKFSEAFKKFSAAFDVKIVQHMSQFKDIFTGLFSVFHIFGQAISAAFRAIGSAVGFLAPIGDSLLDFAAAIGRGITAIDQFVTKSKIFERVFSDIGSVLRPAAQLLNKFFTGIADGVKNFAKLDGGLDDTFNKFGAKMKNVTEGVSSFGESIGNVFYNIASAFGTVLGGLGRGLIEFIHNVSLTDAVVTVLLSRAALNIKYFLYKLQPFSNVGDKIVGILGNTRTALLGFTRDLNAKALMHIAAAIALLAVALIGISALDTTKLATSLLGIGAIMAELYAFMFAFTKLSGKLKGFATVSVSLMALGVALLLIAGAMKVLSSMSWEGIAKGLIGMAGALMSIAAAMQLMPPGAKMLAIGPSMLAVAAAMLVMSGALKAMGSMSIESIGRSLLVLGGALAELAIGLHAMTGTLSGSAALVVAAAALMLLAPALKILGTMDSDSIVHSLIALSGALMVLSVAATAMKGSTASMVMVAASLGVLGASLLLLAPALKMLGTISWESLAKGLAAIAGSLLVLGVAGTVLGGVALQMTLVAASIGILGAALLIFVPALTALGSLKTETIVKGLVALAATFGVLGLAGVLLGPITPILLALSVAIGIFGAAVLAVGAGVALFGAGLTALAALTAPALENIGNALKTVIGIIPEFATAMAQGLVNVLSVLAQNAPQVVSSIITLLGELLNQLTTLVPKMAEVGLQMIIGLLTAIRDHLPEIVELGMEIITGFLRGIADHINEVVDAGLDIVKGVIKGIADNAKDLATEAGHLVAEFIRGLGEAAKDILSAGADFVRNLGQGIRDHISALGEFAGDIIAGFIEAIDAESERIITAGKNLIVHFLEGIGEAAIEISNAATDVIVKFCEALGNNAGLIMWAVSNLFKQIKSAFATEFPMLADFLGIEAEEVSWEFPEKYAQGTYERLPVATEAVEKGGEDILSRIQGFKEKFGPPAQEAGAEVPEGVSNGVESNSGGAISSVNAFGERVKGEIASQGPEYESSGETSGAQAPQGVATGIDNNASIATNSASNLGKSVAAKLREAGTTVYNAAKATGEQADRGLAAGIHGLMSVATAAADAVAAAVSARLNSALQVNSPSKVTMKIGNSVTEGFAMGITNMIPMAEKSSEKLADRTIEAAKKFLKINSPSKVARDEIGNYIVEGIAEGIDENTSAEDAAAKKAQNIINAFKTELDKADLTDSINKFEYEIWSALNPDASEDAKNSKALELQMKDLESQTERINLLLGRVRITKETFGEDSEEYRTAYNELLKEIKTYAESIGELKALAKTFDTGGDNVDINKQVQLWAYNNQETLKILRENLHKTDEEIRQYILDQLGYKGEPEENTYGAAVKAALSDYEQFITVMNDALKSGNLAMMDQFKAGTHYADLLAASVKDSGEEVKAAGDEVGEGTVETIESYGKDMIDVGTSLMDKLAKGISERGAVAVNAVKHVGQQINEALAATTSASNASTISAVSTASKSGASSIIETPAVTTAKVSKSAINFDKASEPQKKEVQVNNVTNYNMTQNNNSPKAISNADVYRATKTLLSSTKNLITNPSAARAAVDPILKTMGVTA